MAQPCTPWITGDDVADCCSVESSSGIAFDEAAEQASEVLFALSGRLFPGECGPKTVRPYCDSCYCGYQVLSRGHVVGPWDWGGFVYSYLCNSCLVACSPSLVKLSGYPVREVSEVKIGGAVLAADQYAIWQNRYLKRLDDGRWPWSQDLTLADSEDNTFSITYTYGTDPPAIALAAAAELGCEIYKACSGATCALPKGTTRVTRQGITIDRLAFTAWAFRRDRGWQTGLPLVDSFLAAYNPSGLKRRPVFWAPGHRQYAQEFGR